MEREGKDWSESRRLWIHSTNEKKDRYDLYGHTRRHHHYHHHHRKVFGHKLTGLSYLFLHLHHHLHHHVLLLHFQWSDKNEALLLSYLSLASGLLWHSTQSVSGHGFLYFFPSIQRARERVRDFRLCSCCQSTGDNFLLLLQLPLSLRFNCIYIYDDDHQCFEMCALLVCVLWPLFCWFLPAVLAVSFFHSDNQSRSVCFCVLWRHIWNCESLYLYQVATAKCLLLPLLLIFALTCTWRPLFAY